MRTPGAAAIRMRRAFVSFFRHEEGTQMIEFAIALPFLLLMFAGAVELGRLFHTYTTLTKATVVGARHLSEPVIAVDGTGYAASDISAAKNLMICGVAANCSNATPIVSGFTTTNISITPPPATSGVRYVTVSVSYDYTPVVFNLAGMTGIQDLSLNYTLTPETTMRYLRDAE